MGIILTESVEKLYAIVVSNDQAVVSTTVVVSETVFVGGTNKIGIWYKAVSVSGSPDITLEYQVAPIDNAGDYVTPESGAVIVANLTDEFAHADCLDDLALQNWLRIKITGNAGNPADTVVTIVINKEG